MKTIYDLAITLAQDPEQVADAQALTQDKNRPHMGLKGVYGLFGSAKWWNNLKVTCFRETGPFDLGKFSFSMWAAE